MIKHLILLKIPEWISKRSNTLATRDKSARDGTVENENMSNQELAEELHKIIIRKFEKRKKYSSFIDNIWGADLADMQFISKFNKEVCFLIMCC